MMHNLTMFGFIIAFYQLGRNQHQIEYQKLKDEDPTGAIDYEPPPYATALRHWDFTALGAFIHVYLSSLGEFDIDSYLGSPM